MEDPELLAVFREARAESFIKTMIAKSVFNWDNVRLVMDDFHDADDLKYGKSDLAFAHGVYYHSSAPFFFFENLMSLADNIFIGGYTYAEASAASNGLFEILEYEIPFSLRDIIASQSFPMRSQTTRGAIVSCDFSLPEVSDARSRSPGSIRHGR